MYQSPLQLSFYININQNHVKRIKTGKNSPTLLDNSEIRAQLHSTHSPTMLFKTKMRTMRTNI
ncbi:hypothetical protein A9Q84_13630 [Halobacteriovorax marinus]|uniref:Uncharacterized protein n=1 Tax=Halobacteriovorax marinus TaxID=97084 RepID=A0A1Y5FEQ1_9BACT|nr:hypothetical protein A9Q84_13630 [Halobacteriovorax marinus]